MAAPYPSFPASPTIGQSYTDANGAVWVYGNTGWEKKTISLTSDPSIWQDVTTATFGAGTAASPSISFSDDPNTGIYRPGPDQLAISTNGAGRLFVDASGNVGVGATPSYALDVTGLINTRNANSSAFDAIQFYGTGMGTNNKFWRTQITTTDQNWQTVDDAYTTANTWLKATRNGNQVETISFLTGTSGTTERLRITSTGQLSHIGAGSSSTPAVSFSGSAPVNSLVVDSSGRCGIGSSAPSEKLQVVSTGVKSTIAIGDGAIGTYSQLLMYGGSGKYNWSIGAQYNVNNAFEITPSTAAGGTTFSSPAFVIDSSSRVGIGVTSPGAPLEVNGTVICGRTDGSAYIINRGGYSSSTVYAFWGNDTTGISNPAAGQLGFLAAGSERARIDSSGRFLVGTSSATGANSYTGLVLRSVTNTNTPGELIFQNGYSTGIGAGGVLGSMLFQTNSGNTYAKIEAIVDAADAANDYPGRLVFSTTADGASSPTSRMTITSDGSVSINKSVPNSTLKGWQYSVSDGTQGTTSDAATSLIVNRLTDDGTLISLRQASTEEGSISVSGTTVSYNGAHLSRWSQLPSGAERTEILRGTVLSNIDEMCEWGDEDNEQLNRMKVSDVEGDKNVSGVFQAWDDDDDTYTNDFYCAMTGDFIIRIAQGVTVERGDLLMSAGDGTAKPQDDDIIRSKTIAKVTSTNVSCTYDDGSYCVPCVLMAC